MIRCPSRTTNYTVGTRLRERSVPSTRVRSWNTTDVIVWNRCIECYGLTGDTWLVSSKLDCVDHVSNALAYLNATGSITKIEVAAPEIVS